MKDAGKYETLQNENIIEEVYEEESNNGDSFQSLSDFECVNEADKLDLSHSYEVLELSKTTENISRFSINLRGLIFCADDQLINIEILKQHLEQLG